MLLANFNGKEHLRHRAVSLRQHGFLVVLYCIDRLTAAEGSPGGGTESNKAAGKTCQTQPRFVRIGVATSHRVDGSSNDVYTHVWPHLLSLSKKLTN